MTDGGETTRLGDGEAGSARMHRKGVAMFTLPLEELLRFLPFA